MITLVTSSDNFYAKYSDFLRALAAFVGGNINSITIKSIGSGVVRSSQSQSSFKMLASGETTQVSGMATVT